MNLNNYLRRYTELPFLIDYLSTKEIVLMSPNSWDDKNDSYYIDRYSEQKSLARVAALCLTESSETYHHWKIFSSGASDVCIEFDKKQLLKHTSDIKGLRSDSVRYYTIDQLKKCSPEEYELPFIKRHAFKDEMEFRIFWESELVGENMFRVEMPLSTINRIILGPWIPKSVSDHVKEVLKGIPDCKNLQICRSTLIDNERWKKLSRNE